MPHTTDLRQRRAEPPVREAGPRAQNSLNEGGFRLSLWQDGRHQAELRIAGPVVGQALDTVRAQLRCLLNTGISVLIVDISDVTSVGPGFAPALDFVRRLMRVRQGYLCVTDTPAPTRAART